MKKLFFTFFVCLFALSAMADSLLFDSFEYANHDLNPPIGWICDDASWLCGYLDKDHNRTPHHGNWYAFTNADESWMFMPAFLSNQLRYRFSYWAISDGSYTVEFWAGNGASQGQMSRLLFSAEINGGEYERVSAYIEDLATSYEYFGIHAIASPGAYHCTIDEINVDMVDRYNMEINPYQIDTVMYPNTRITFQYTVQNTGYESLHIYMSALTDFFTNVQFTANGASASSFYTVPDQIVQCSCTATLKPNIAPGTRCWIDIMFTVSCDCITRMTTIWADALGQVDEFPLEAHLDTPQFMRDGWIVLDDRAPQWRWMSEGENGCMPIDDSEGMLGFKASETSRASLLMSPKMALNETGNQARMYLYRTDDNPDREDRVNVYLNTEMTLTGATLLKTIHRSTHLSPAVEEPGWYQCDIDFDSPSSPVFLFIEAVGDHGSDIYLDEIAISNTTLPAPSVTVPESNSHADVRVAPNPAKDLIQVSGEGLTQVQVIDITGRLLKSVIADSENMQLDLEELKPGVYFINATTTEGVSTHKIIKR